MNPLSFKKNIYNIDNIGVLLNILNSLKILIGKNNLGCRGVGVKRTLITAIEYIFVDGRSLHPLIIWPAAIHRST